MIYMYYHNVFLKINTLTITTIANVKFQLKGTSDLTEGDILPEGLYFIQFCFVFLGNSPINLFIWLFLPGIFKDSSISPLFSKFLT